MEADYSVKTKMSFQLTFDDREFNILLLKDVQKAFAQHVKEVYERDDTLREYIDGDLNFHFDNRTVQLEYDFVCCDESRAEAESFSEYCVRCVKKELDEFGCQVKRVTCRAEEKDMVWLDALEDQIFDPRASAPEPEQRPAKSQSPPKRKETGRNGDNQAIFLRFRCSGKVLDILEKLWYGLPLGRGSSMSKKYFASCSFGKDSIATLLLAKEHGEPLDETVYCEVMFDSTISGEVPEHRDFIYGTAIPALERMGIKIIVLRSEKTYVGLFTGRITRSPKNGEVQPHTEIL